MGQAVECDLTGELVRGAGVPRVFVDVRPKVRLNVSVEVAQDEAGDRFATGQFGPKGRDKVVSALSGLIEKSKASKKE